MKEALFYKKKEGKKVQCHLCPNECLINEGNIGICKVKKNIEGKLFSLVYGQAVSLAVDPIEKKPLFHFYPESKILSFGTVGCNLKCKFCQNWEISQIGPEEYSIPDTPPEKIIKTAISQGCDSIAYTYTEPTIFYEYILDCAKLAKEKGLKNVIVSNGFINPEPLKELLRYIDAANIDLKSFEESFYTKICGAKLKPVLDTIKTIAKSDTWLEITNLIIPTLNDDMKKIKEMCVWIKNNAGADVPLHFSAFYPCYKLQDIQPTSKETLMEARKIAQDVGMKYVYAGNVFADEAENTYCPKCGELIISRYRFIIKENKLDKGKCGKCRSNIEGVW